MLKGRSAQGAGLPSWLSCSLASSWLPAPHSALTHVILPMLLQSPTKILTGQDNLRRQAHPCRLYTFMSQAALLTWRDAALWFICLIAGSPTHAAPTPASRHLSL